MSQKNKKQFGVWMDSHHATVVGSQLADGRNLGILFHAENAVKTIIQMMATIVVI